VVRIVTDIKCLDSDMVLPLECLTLSVGRTDNIRTTFIPTREGATTCVQRCRREDKKRVDVHANNIWTLCLFIGLYNYQNPLHIERQFDYSLFIFLLFLRFFICDPKKLHKQTATLLNHIMY
jgi:hypothetical protein